MKKILTALLVAIATTNPAFADDCQPYFAGIFTNEPVTLKVHVTRLRLNLDDGRTGWLSFGMDQNYQNGVSGMGDGNDHFIARTTGGGLYDVIQGSFTELFSDRSSNVTDTTTLELRQDGTANIRLDSWGNYTFALRDMSCYHINDNPRLFALSTMENSELYTKWLFSIERL